MISLGTPPNKVAVIPNGADPHKFHPLPKEDCRTRLDLPNQPLILSVGALTENKGFHRLIKAFRIVIERVPEKNVHLRIVGEGPYRPQLESLIASLDLSQRVRLVGAVPHNNLPLWFNAADLFCLCSAREGWPCVVVESLACGTPAVATDIWGIRELITSDSFGLMTTLDEEDIAKKILRALSTSWDRDRIVGYAQNYAWERVAFSAYDVLRSTLQGDATTSLSGDPVEVVTQK
jgi:glycosyltransferase involved in cell wall biosynthesis